MTGRTSSGGRRSNTAKPSAQTVIVLEEFLPYRLQVTTSRISTALARLYEERFGLSIPEWRMLAVLARFPGVSANDAADRSAMDKVTVSRAVARLIERNFLIREMADDDRRRSQLRLTTEGHAVYAEIAPLALDYERKLLGSLTHNEMRMLDSLLLKLNRTMDELQIDGGGSGDGKTKAAIAGARGKELASV